MSTGVALSIKKGEKLSTKQGETLEIALVLLQLLNATTKLILLRVVKIIVSIAGPKKPQVLALNK